MTVAETAQMDTVITGLTTRFGSDISIDTSGNETIVISRKNIVHDVLAFLKSEKAAGFTMLTDLFAIDHFGADPRFEVVYLLTSIETKRRIVVKAQVADGESIPTVTDIWQGANWYEREALDMFGLVFEGHPDPRRILTIDGFEGYPLRKDFPTEGFDFDKPFKVDLQEGME
jgi:NADH-quinone oxidoreductase subunit C